MSTTKPTKRNLGDLYTRADDQRRIEETGPSIRGVSFFIFSVIIALIADHYAGIWAPHLLQMERTSFALAVWLTVWMSPALRLIPSRDAQSRLKAVWSPNGKRVALLLTGIIWGGSLFYCHHRLDLQAPLLTVEMIDSLKPIKAGTYTLVGTPKEDQDPYRWAMNDIVEGAPYLIPITEFNGRVIIVSDTYFQEPVHLKGNLLKAMERSLIHFHAYRNYMGISPTEPLYLVDVRGWSSFDVRSWTLFLLATLSLLAVWSTATRDPENRSRLLYIPMELRGEYNDDEMDILGELEPPHSTPAEIEPADVAHPEIALAEVESAESPERSTEIPSETLAEPDHDDGEGAIEPTPGEGIS